MYLYRVEWSYVIGSGASAVGDKDSGQFTAKTVDAALKKARKHAEDMGTDSRMEFTNCVQIARVDG